MNNTHYIAPPLSNEELIARHTDTKKSDWESVDGPSSGCGEDFYYRNKFTKSEVYLNDDQGFVTIECDGDIVFQQEI